MNALHYETLAKLGEAIYKHAFLIKKAEKAEKAVEYLEKEKVLNK